MEEIVLKLRRATDGIFTVLRVHPEHIVKLDSLPSGGTEVIVRGVDGTVTQVEVMNSEEEIKALIQECKELNSSPNSDDES